MPKSSIDPIVVRNLRSALARQGRTAYSVANALGHPSNWLYQVLQGRYGLLIPSLREIARELGVSVCSLVDAAEDIPETDSPAGPDASVTGTRLTNARKKSGRTQKELAAALGGPCNQQMISEQAALAARELGVSLDYPAGNLGTSHGVPAERTAKSKKTLWPSPTGEGSMTIAPNIMHIRGRIAEIGIVQADLATHLGIHESLLNAHLRGRRPMPEGLEEHIHSTLDLMERAKRAGREAEQRVMQEGRRG